MKQAQLDQLLAWTMLAAMKSAVVEHQNILGRDLTTDEYKQCHVDTYKAAGLIQEQLTLNRGTAHT